MSERQFRAFGIRPAVARDLPNYSLLELNLSVLISLRRDVVLTNREHQNLNRLLAELGMPQLYVGVDISNSIEMRHRTFELSPRRFRETVLRLEEHFRRPDTHLHIGIPAEITRQELTTIARAMETLITLDLALEGGAPAGLPYVQFTTLSGNNLRAQDGRRSVISYALREWSEPHLSHNLEIRQYPSVSRGLEYLEIAAHLTQNASRLRHIQVPLFARRNGQLLIDDWNSANLQGALYYSAALLRHSTDARHRLVADQLSQLELEMRESGEISPSMRVRVRDYLRSVRIRDIVTAELFLAPTPE